MLNSLDEATNAFDKLSFMRCDEIRRPEITCIYRAFENWPVTSSFYRRRSKLKLVKVELATHCHLRSPVPLVAVGIINRQQLTLMKHSWQAQQCVQCKEQNEIDRKNWCGRLFYSRRKSRSLHVLRKWPRREQTTFQKSGQSAAEILMIQQFVFFYSRT